MSHKDRNRHSHRDREVGKRRGTDTCRLQVHGHRETATDRWNRQTKDTERAGRQAGRPRETATETQG